MCVKLEKIINVIMKIQSKLKNKFKKYTENTKKIFTKEMHIHFQKDT